MRPKPRRVTGGPLRPRGAVGSDIVVLKYVESVCMGSNCSPKLGVQGKQMFDDTGVVEGNFTKTSRFPNGQS